MNDLLAMGYQPGVIKKALKLAKSEEIDTNTIIDLIQQMVVETSKKPPTKKWSCPSCTFLNSPKMTKCQMCG